MWFIGVEVEQETSAPPPKKTPGSAPVVQFCIFFVRVSALGFLFLFWDLYFCFLVVFFCFGFAVSCFCIDGTLRKEKQSLHCVFVYYL